ncbi:MAG: hypothetical protein HKN73_15070 [Gemmatimonadetes bacterium]|nr:hypothetical protein [Gemmatimonadota bacterium]
MRRGLFGVGAMAIWASGCSPVQPHVPAAERARLFSVPVPASGEAVYEPHLAVAEDGTVLLAGQYGEGYNRGGLRFWTAWLGPDEEWNAGEAVLTRPGRTPTMAADVTVAAGPDQRWYLFGLAADSVRYGVPDASLSLALVPEGRVLARVREVSEPRTGLLYATDKPWMVRDPGGEGREASLVLGWTELEVDLNESPVSIRRTLVIGVASEDGRFRQEPVSVAAEAMGVQLAVASDGTLDATWTDLREEGSATSVRIRHARSLDGGRSFGPAEVVADVAADSGTAVGHGTLASGPGGALVACWPQWTLEAETPSVHCAERAGDRWTGLPSPGGTEQATRAFPALAWAGGRWWLSFYEASGAVLRVSLASRAPGDPAWRDEGVLAETVGFDGRFCPAPSLPCRADPDAFFPGDYVSAAGNGSTLAVAFVLPGDGSRTDDILSVSILESGPRGAAGSAPEGGPL